MTGCLEDLGANEELLTADQRSQLDEQGFVNLGVLLTPFELNKTRSRIGELLQEERDHAGCELFESPHIRHPKEAGATRLADLVNKGDIFDLFYTHPVVLAAVSRVIGQQVQLSSLNYRSAIPGAGAQKLHVDWHEVIAPGNYVVCNSIWLLDDFSAANGATRVIPGTHRAAQLPQDVLANPEARHPDEVLIEAPAGTVVVFNSHVWHGGTLNTTDSPRRAIHSYFCQRGQPQQVDQRKYLRPETAARLSKAALQVLGVLKE